MSISRRIAPPLLLFVVIGMIEIFLTAHWGIGVQPDSASYLGAARNLRSGLGLTVPAPDGVATYNYFAPFYPVFLAAVSLNTDPVQTAVWVNALFMGGSIFLVGLAVSRCTQSIWATLIGACLVTFAPHMLRSHSLLISEPPFVFFCLLTWLLLSIYLEKPNILLLIAVSLAAGFAFLSRYAGIALIGASAFTILILSRQPLVRRVVSIAVLVIISTPLTFLFMFAQGGRTSAFHPIPLNKLASGIFTLTQWIVPENLTRWLVHGIQTRQPLSFVVAAILGLLVLGLLVALVTGLRHLNWPQIRSWLGGMHVLFWVLIIFSVLYVGFLLFSVSFLDAYTWLDDRIMLPVHVALIIAMTYLGWRLFQSIPTDLWQRRALAAFGVIVIASYIIQGALQTGSDYSNGVHFADAEWRESPTIDFVRSLPPNSLIYTNNREVIYLMTGHTSYHLPFLYDYTSLLPNDNFETELTAMADQLKDEGGYLIYFVDNNRVHIVTLDELKSRFPLTLVKTDDEAAIYQAS